MTQFSAAALPCNSAPRAGRATAGPVKHRGMSKPVRQAASTCRGRDRGEEEGMGVGYERRGSEYGAPVIEEKWAKLINISDTNVVNGERMDSLGGIAMFVQVADSGSFSATGRLLGLSSSAVGKSVARMETRLGVRLFQRSTRHLALTAEGEKFLQRCKRILAEVEAAERELGESGSAPSGRLRLSLPRYSGLFEPAIGAFMQAYPAIELDLDFSDAMVNIVSDGFDAAVRTGELADSSLMRRKLCTFRRLLLASPAYLARHGRPADGAALLRHARLDYRFPATGRLEQWPLLDESTQPAPGMVCNSVEMRVFLAVQGQGIAYLPAFAVQRKLAAGQLVSLLDAHTQTRTAFWLLWPGSRHLPPRLRVFIDFLVEHLQDRHFGS